MGARTAAGLLVLAAAVVSACSSEPSYPSLSDTDGLPAMHGGMGGTGGTSATTTASTGGGTTTSGSLPALRVLFVGNSYTFVNDLPGTVAQIANASGIVTMEVDSVAVGGATLAQQVDSTGALPRIQQGGYTHVVLQGQSEEPLADPSDFEAAAATLAAAAQAAGERTVFYETWARQAGDVDYQSAWSGGTPAAMQAGLRQEYAKVAMQAGAPVAPAGDAWEKALTQLPAITLFQSDGSHPTVAGTYLIAAVFYGTLTGHDPTPITVHPAGLADADAASLRGVAQETVGGM